MAADKNDTSAKPGRKPTVEERLCDKANKSSRRFIGELGMAIMGIPKIREKSQEAADKKCHRILDRLFKAFVEAQSDVYKLGFYSTLGQLTEAKEGEIKKTLTTLLQAVRGFDILCGVGPRG